MLESNSKSRSWDSKVHDAFPQCISKANLPHWWATDPLWASLSHDASGGPWKGWTFKGLWTSLVSPTTVEAAIIFHQNGELRGPPWQGHHCDAFDKLDFQWEGGKPAILCQGTLKILCSNALCESWTTVCLSLFMFLSWLLVLFYCCTCAFL
jgi:hypothetical protein